MDIGPLVTFFRAAGVGRSVDALRVLGGGPGFHDGDSVDVKKFRAEAVRIGALTMDQAWRLTRRLDPDGTLIITHQAFRDEVAIFVARYSGRR